jgi:DMATS type aromatic prenyltransferase
MALWQAAMHRQCPIEIQEIFRTLLSPWGDASIPKSPTWPSDIGGDHSPFEFSLAVGRDQPELRVLVEAQANDPNSAAFWAAGLELTERLNREQGVDTNQFVKVRDLFSPDSLKSSFAIWHAVCLSAGGPPAWKIYLNPQARGRAAAGEVVEEALARLGYPRVWRSLSRNAAGRGPDLDELKYFSLDLSGAPDARVKIYFAHHQVAASELERSFSPAKNYVSGDATEFCRALLASTGPFRAAPLGSCFSFVGADCDVPSAATLHLPVGRYVQNDALIKERVQDYLEKYGIATAPYLESLAALADRPLDSGAGIQTYVSARRAKLGQRVTLYLASPVYDKLQVA